MGQIKYFSTFTGIGGFELGVGPEHECVGYSEIDKYAIQIYEKHFPTHRNYGDITKIDAERLPDFDILVGGFPCQAFSIAGKREGFSDTRGTLFFDVARIVKQKQPRLLLLENVKGLLSHDKGRTFHTIITTLDELGYDCQWQVLNSKNHGVPQNRERVFIIGHLRGTPRPEVLPFTESNGSHLQEITKGVSDAQRIYKDEGVAKTLKGLGGGLGAKTGLYKVRIPEATKKGYAEAQEGDSINLSVLSSKTRRGRVGKGIAQTLDTGMQQHTLVSKTVRAGGRNSPHGCKQNWDTYEVGGQIRRLTPIECERLQGFPDGWTAHGLVKSMWDLGLNQSRDGVVEISDTQRYKTLGNAVTVNVVRDITSRLLGNSQINSII